jgi:integrase
VSGILRVERQREADHRKNNVPHFVTVDHPALADALAWTMAHGVEIRSKTGRFKGVCLGYLFPWAEKRTAGILARLRLSLPPGYLPKGTAWHGFRHWGASELARDGATVWDVQSWLGDKDPKMAARYVSMVRGETGSCVSRLARRIYRKVGRASGCNPKPCPNPLSRSADRMVRNADRRAFDHGAQHVRHNQKPST